MTRLAKLWIIPDIIKRHISHSTGRSEKNNPDSPKNSKNNKPTDDWMRFCKN
jgi:hypothetical protein